MEKKNDGGSAYPIVSKNYVGGGQYEQQVDSGLSLRDYFAGQTITVLIPKKRDAGFIHDPLKSAQMAYQIADAMITERDK